MCGLGFHALFLGFLALTLGLHMTSKGVQVRMSLPKKWILFRQPSKENLQRTLKRALLPSGNRPDGTTSGSTTARAWTPWITFAPTKCSNLLCSGSGQPTQLTRPNNARNRIVGGMRTSISAAPYQVSLRYGGTHICGAAIIADYWAITAGHCTDKLVTLKMSLLAGSEMVNNQDNKGTIYDVQKVVKHPGYSSITKENDISLLQVFQIFMYTPNVQYIPLPAQNESIEDYYPCRISGWGHLIENGNVSTTLQEATLPTIPLQICEDIYKPYGGIITSSMICAGVSEGGIDACQGDSGGPLNCGNILTGIVSWGRGCARPGFPGVFTRVAAYVNWIQSVMNPPPVGKKRGRKGKSRSNNGALEDNSGTGRRDRDFISDYDD